ncbi:N-acetylmuramoyl-L-alanine amidase AmiD precursor [Pseudovibrio axinellae]|uniref:N-acetylmuramoyl-L-alanine amidase n=1 Tax=Pseudovibrio axinellae TaxID=989403 RepID=A0A166ASW4_9HYPH|nr:N-acetylmuramoyl-L-alanine amidase [Pseudovibrio axinellae]KZL21508.1 N-acetylmuramoyl-L-alanine amidase AmiD precursor [Pseudovibrio axinellae]SER07587.1 N-acetylmuramoyl-L-alanine amidase [Pseudovibrio axinellae]
MSVSSECAVPARLRPSPNHNERRVSNVDMLILHYTAMESAEKAIAWLCDPRSEVSCHYLVDEMGMVTQMVPESRRAWHAGVSSWKGEGDLNSRSIGIEISNLGDREGGTQTYPEVQIETVIALAKDICARHNITSERVLGHSDVAPMRKQDPGRHFPWGRLAEAGVGHFIEPLDIESASYFQEGDEGQPIEALQSLLGLYGYELGVSGVFDEKTRYVVEAFQRHFRPSKVDGIADAQTIATLHGLLKGLKTL